VIFDPPFPDGVKSEEIGREVRIGDTVRCRIPRPFVISPDLDEWLKIARRIESGERVSDYEKLQWEDGPDGIFLSPLFDYTLHTRIA